MKSSPVTCSCVTIGLITVSCSGRHKRQTSGRGVKALPAKIKKLRIIKKAGHHAITEQKRGKHYPNTGRGKVCQMPFGRI